MVEAALVHALIAPLVNTRLSRSIGTPNVTHVLVVEQVIIEVVALDVRRVHVLLVHQENISFHLDCKVVLYVDTAHLPSIVKVVQNTPLVLVLLALLENIKKYTHHITLAALGVQLVLQVIIGQVVGIIKLEFVKLVHGVSIRADITIGTQGVIFVTLVRQVILGRTVPEKNTGHIFR